MNRAAARMTCSWAAASARAPGRRIFVGGSMTDLVWWVAPAAADSGTSRAGQPEANQSANNEKQKKP
jgi:hypothetical protein